MGGHVSSDDSDAENHMQVDQQYEIKQKIEKVNAEEFKTAQTKIQEKGFQWVIEAQEEGKIKKRQANQYITNVLTSTKELVQQKDMFGKICGFVTKSLNTFKTTSLDPLSSAD